MFGFAFLYFYLFLDLHLIGFRVDAHAVGTPDSIACVLDLPLLNPCVHVTRVLQIDPIPIFSAFLLPFLTKLAGTDLLDGFAAILIAGDIRQTGNPIVYL